MRISHCFVALLGVAACAAKTKDTTTTTTTPTSTAGSVLAISELKFFEGDKLGLHLHPDGRLEGLETRNGAEAWHDLAILKADGTITPPNGGTAAHVNADGSFVGPKGEVAPFKLDGATLVSSDGKKISLDAKGNLVLDGKPGEKAFRVEGATDAATQRTALVIMAMLMEGEEHPAPPTKVEVPPAK
jgi:hypothetical protein